MRMCSEEILKALGSNLWFRNLMLPTVDMAEYGRVPGMSVSNVSNLNGTNTYVRM